MLLSLEVNDNKSKVFLDFLNNLDFVKIQRSELSDESYLNLVNERLEEYTKNPDEGIEAKEFLEKLKAKYDF